MRPVRDHFRTLAARSEAETRVHRSRFLGVAFPLDSEGEGDRQLADAARHYFDATHHCWAFRPFEAPARSSDAGEPSGTAGKPILGAIESAGLEDVGVVVARWYGGVKLGSGGLGRAYRDAAAAALAAGVITDRWIYERIRVIGTHNQANQIFRLLKAPDVVLASSEFGADARFELDVRKSILPDILETLRAMRVEAEREESPKKRT